MTYTFIQVSQDPLVIWKSNVMNTNMATTAIFNRVKKNKKNREKEFDKSTYGFLPYLAIPILFYWSYQTFLSPNFNRLWLMNCLHLHVYKVHCAPSSPTDWSGKEGRKKGSVIHDVPHWLNTCVNSIRALTVHGLHPTLLHVLRLFLHPSLLYCLQLRLRESLTVCVLAG